MRRRNLALNLILASLSVATGLAAFAPAARAAGHAPAGFIENRGQLDKDVQFYANGDRAAVYLTGNAVVLDLKADPASLRRVTPAEDTPEGRLLEPAAIEPGQTLGCAVHIRFPGANMHPVIEGRTQLPATYNYFLGRDASRWHRGVRAWTEVVYRDLWPGIDLVLANDRGRVSYRFDVAPGADASAIRVEYAGADRVTALGPGRFEIVTPVGSFIDQRPDGAQAGGYSLEATPGRGMGGSQILDNPASLSYSTFLGAVDDDRCQGLALDAAERPVVAGWSVSSGFPFTPGAYDTLASGSGDAFVAKFDTTASALVWCTYLGDVSDDRALALALDSSDNVIVTGWTLSTLFPVTPAAYDTSWNGYTDCFVTKLSEDGGTLVWSTFLGGRNLDRGWGVAVDNADNVFVCGDAESLFVTTPGAPDPLCRPGDRDGFVAKFNATADSLLWSSFLGGSGGTDAAFGIAVDGSQRPVVTGFTQTDSFPTVAGSYDVTRNGSTDAFVTRFSADGDSLLQSSFLGGISADVGYAIVIDGSGNPMVTGFANSSNFPTTGGVYDVSQNGSSDVFVTRFNPGITALGWSTFVGGSKEDRAYALALDNSGNVLVTGYTRSDASGVPFPTTASGYDTSWNGSGPTSPTPFDAFLVRLNSSGSLLNWGSFLGGTGNDVGWAVTSNTAGLAILAGGTLSSGFPGSASAFDNTQNGAEDGFLTRFDFGPAAAPASVPGDLAAGAGRGIALPNPARGEVMFRVSGMSAGAATLRIYDTQGRLVRTLHQDVPASSLHEATWDGRDEAGQLVRAGVYYYAMTSGASRVTGKLSIVR